MYNRYIPQPDGSYHRRRIQDQTRPPEPAKNTACSPPEPPRPPEGLPEPGGKPHCAHLHPPRPYHPPQKKQEQDPSGILSFLRQLLPRNFDTADLIVILLLLLISADSCDDNSALLTLALYLFL